MSARLCRFVAGKSHTFRLTFPPHLTITSQLVVYFSRSALSFLAGSGFFSGRERLRRWKMRLRAGSFDAPAFSSSQLLDHPGLHNQPPYY